MNTKLALVTLGISAVMASTVFAGDIKPLHADPTIRDIQSPAGNCDIIKFQCGTGTGINQATARVIDIAPVAKPIVTVQTAPWTGAACGAFTAAKWDTATNTLPRNSNNTPWTGDNNSSYSEETAPVAAVSGGFYCVKVCKVAGRQNNAGTPDTAAVAETYKLDHHCSNNGSATHPQSVYPGTYIQNQ
jgi:hypothetical protein